MNQIEALARQPEFPDSLVRNALEIEQDDAGDAEADLHENDDAASPPEERFQAIAGRRKEAAPFNQDGGLEQGKVRLIEAAHEHDVLRAGQFCSFFLYTSRTWRRETNKAGRYHILELEIVLMDEVSRLLDQGVSEVHLHNEYTKRQCHKYYRGVSRHSSSQKHNEIKQSHILQSGIFARDIPSRTLAGTRKSSKPPDRA